MKISRQQLRKIIQEAFWSNKDIGSVEDVETVGDLRKLIASAQDAKRWEQTKGEAGEAVKGAIVDEILGKIPGASAAKSLFDFVKASYDLPDDARTGTALDHLDVDDDVAKIVDDPIENSFLDALGKKLESMDGEKRLADLDMTSLLSDYIRAEFNSRTVSGFKEGKTMKITKTQLKKIIEEEFKASSKRSVNESANADEYYEEEVLDFAFSISQTFKQDQSQLFDAGLEPAQGRITREEWLQQLEVAGNQLRKVIERAVKKNIDSAISKFETQLHKGRFQR